MRSVPSVLKIAVAAGALAVAAPAAAQYTFLSPDKEPPAVRLRGWDNVVRVNLGAGFYNSDWYNCAYGWYYQSCSPSAYASYIPFLVGPQIDIHVGGPSNLSVGLTVAFGTVKTTYFDGTQDVKKSAKVTTYEPTLDYLVKLGTPMDDTAARLRFGGGLIIGPDSRLGYVGRIGAGTSFFNAGRLGVGLDLVLEVGTMSGYFIGGLQLLASPEFHF
jgi:hypothetical protein